MGHLVRGILTGVLVLWLSPSAALSQSSLPSGDLSTYQKLHLFFETLEKIEDYYLEPLTLDQLIDLAIEGMMSGLDDHSRFMDENAFRSLQSLTQGSFCGVGVVVAIRGDCPTVISPMENTPASRAGIRTGDRLVAIDSVDTRAASLEEIVTRLRGDAGTPVRLSLLRMGAERPITLTLLRERIDVKSVIGPLFFDGGIAYVGLRRFCETTADDLESALAALDDRGVEGLILDLRGNPGGLLSQAVHVADHFVPPGEVIVEVRSRDPADCRTFRASTRAKWSRPVAVIVDGGSASAAEIVAGAIQDHHRGLIVGSETFGKGSVQSIFSLESRHAIKLTTAAYFTPSGRSVERTSGPDGEGKAEGGITPDLVVDGSEPDSLTLGLVSDGLVGSFVARRPDLAPADLSVPLGDDYIGLFLDYVAAEGERGISAGGAADLNLAIREVIAMEAGGESAALRIRLNEDRQFLKACDALRSLSGAVAASETLIASP